MSIEQEDTLWCTISIIYLKNDDDDDDGLTNIDHHDEAHFVCVCVCLGARLRTHTQTL